MKKLTLILGSLLLSGVMYGKEMGVKPVKTAQEEVYIVKVAPVYPYNIYVRAGVDIDSEYDNIALESRKASNGSTDGLGYEIALEGTKNINQNIEFGLGIAYQRHSDLDSYFGKDWSGPKTFKVKRYDSIPIYLISKYNFNQFNNGLKPYLNINLGISFNMSDGDTQRGNNKIEADVADGLYFGVGGGIEYRNFFIDLMYKMNTGEIGHSYSEYKELYKNDMNYSRVTLGFGYKFSY